MALGAYAGQHVMADPTAGSSHRNRGVVKFTGLADYHSPNAWHSPYAWPTCTLG